MSFFELRKFCDSCPTLTEGEVESGIVDLVLKRSVAHSRFCVAL